MDEEEPLVGGLKEFIPQKHEIVNKEWFSKPANSCWFSLLITAVAAGFLYVCFALTGLIEIFAGNEVCPIMNLSDLTDQVPVLARQFWLKSGRQKLELFESFKRTHNKKYSSSEEEQKRLDIFLGNLDRIDELNAKRNGATYGLTKFADLTKEEFSDRNKLQFESNFQVLADDTVGYVAFSDVISDGLVDDSAKIPCEWDWRTKGAVTPVQNQGLCGDCFSFATVGSVEGTNFLATGNLVELSEQEITSCGTVDQFVSTISPTILSDEENSDDEESQRRLSSSSSSSSLELNGCEGGSLAGAFADVYQNGLVPASAYPYESFYGTAPACDEAVVESASSEAVHIGGWTWILDNDNDLDAGASISTIKRALMSLGPIAVGINAEQMQFYIGGVDHASLCLAQPPDHAVLLVGFGYSRGGPYWLIKNSWGTSWGEDGYYRIAEELGACYLQDMALVGLPAAAAAATR